MRRVLKAKFFSLLSDSYFDQIIFNYMRMKHNKLPKSLNIDNPKSFSEKIVWLKRNYAHDSAHVIADKYMVRSYVEREIDGGILVPLYQVLDRDSSIDFNRLPKKFVVKPNHASGEIIFVDQDSCNISDIREQVEEWFSLDYGALGHEHHYSKIDPKVLIEMDLTELNGSCEVNDYKFHCFNGVVKLVQVDSARHSDHKRDFYDTEWNKLDLRILYPNSEKLFAPPVCLNEMIDVAMILSRKFSFLRVDLYEVNKKVYFGEMTLHPGGGLEPIWPDFYDSLLGDYLDIRSLVDQHRSK